MYAIMKCKQLDGVCEMICHVPNSWYVWDNMACVRWYVMYEMVCHVPIIWHVWNDMACMRWYLYKKIWHVVGILWFRDVLHVLHGGHILHNGLFWIYMWIYVKCIIYTASSRCSVWHVSGRYMACRSMLNVV